MKYVISVDQSTQGTKVVLFDETGQLLKRVDKNHEQLINELGYVSHDPVEIYNNTVFLIKKLIMDSNISTKDVCCLGISNQRETTVMFDREGNPLADAVVWQCARAKDIVRRYEPYSEEIFQISGLTLSPYFPACKMRWLLENTEHDGNYLFGTIDTWLIYKLTHQQSFKTDHSNASRTQLYDLRNGNWSPRLCQLFDINECSLPEICYSDEIFGYTDVEGLFETPIPISGVLGDSHAALFGHRCHSAGQVKTTLGTGSSIMMNIGENCLISHNGLVTSVAYSENGRRQFALEGNINYAGAVVTWLKDDLNLIEKPSDTSKACEKANHNDETVLIPSFTGLGAPYWKMDTKAMFYGMSRTTRKNELIKAAIESIAYQITDILNAMASDTGLSLKGVKADGGPSKNEYLMQFLSETSRCKVSVSNQEELSAIGAAYMAGIACGIFNREQLFYNLQYQEYSYCFDTDRWKKIMDNWYRGIDLLTKK